MENDEACQTTAPDCSNLRVRKALSNDLAALLEIENERFSGDRISAVKFKRFLKQKNAVLLVAESQGKISGYALLIIRSKSKTARIYSIASRLNNGVKGSGSRLLQEIIKISKEADCLRLILEVRADNHYAILFYQKAGFREFGIYQNYYEDGEKALRMEKDL